MRSAKDVSELLVISSSQVKWIEYDINNITLYYHIRFTWPAKMEPASTSETSLVNLIHTPSENPKANKY
jgi:hypothetical protein